MMKTNKIVCFLVSMVLISGCNQNNKKEEEAGSKVTFVQQPDKNRVDVMVDGQLFTAYQWPDSVYKPILYPIHTAAGAPVTRGFPIEPRPDERQDHPHQVGNWFNYGNVNGYDFWGNGSEGKRNVEGGQIKHKSVEVLAEGTNEGLLRSIASWLDPSGTELLKEETNFYFIAEDSVRIIDRVVKITNTGEKPVTFGDTKEGSFGIRVASALEMPAKEDVTLTDASGHPTTVKALSDRRVTGNYRSSEGIEGELIWGTRAKWMNLYGQVEEKPVSLVICDHAKNLSYPTRWHARGYGLFAANPFGTTAFDAKTKALNYTIAAGESLTLRYRIVISSGKHLTDAEINQYSDKFNNKY